MNYCKTDQTVRSNCRRQQTRNNKREMEIQILKRKNERDMDRHNKLFKTKLKDILKLKTSVMVQEFLEDNKNVADCGTQHKTRLMEMEVNNERLEQLIHDI